MLQRLEGYRQALQAAGLYDPTLEWLRSEPSSLALGGELLTQHLRDDPGVDAIFFCNDAPTPSLGPALTAMSPPRHIRRMRVSNRSDRKSVV